MFETMTQIGKRYNIDAKEVGRLLYKLNIRDAKHPTQKGFPFEQAITHGIAKRYDGRGGEQYYRYNIESIQEEFERLVNTLPVSTQTDTTSTKTLKKVPVNRTPVDIETKLKIMLSTLNQAIESGEIVMLYQLKADIADIYALLPSKAS